METPPAVVNSLSLRPQINKDGLLFQRRSGRERLKVSGPGFVISEDNRNADRREKGSGFN